MPRQPAPPVTQPLLIGDNDGPHLDLPSPRWGRAKEAADHYRVGLTKIYDWINTERLITRKADGVRLVLIGAARGIDIAGDPQPDAVPVSRRAENLGRTWRGRRRQAAERVGQPENEG